MLLTALYATRMSRAPMRRVTLCPWKESLRLSQKPMFAARMGEGNVSIREALGRLLGQEARSRRPDLRTVATRVGVDDENVARGDVGLHHSSESTCLGPLGLQKQAKRRDFSPELKE